MKSRVSKFRRRVTTDVERYFKKRAFVHRQSADSWSRLIGIIVEEVGINDKPSFFYPHSRVKEMLDALGLVRWTRQPGLPASPSIIGGWNEMIETLKAADARVRLIGFAPAMKEARESYKS